MQEMQARTGISERRACQLIGLSRSVLRYQPRASVQNTELQAQLVELAQERRHFGYRRLHIRCGVLACRSTTSGSIACTALPA
ncbi:hypothetical protein VNPA120719_51260 [Pseudomonas aeruginosa]|nr:hypothetical protein VNPA110516_57200 [Pseudomonas aeruginosa]GLE78606.1 hypothetical protein VNPA120641_54780 [Pseudomonas aeruginosa]GLE91730.1 hypothetical protein VNPA120719_51260 [Pseudomonas aeruginosa]